jgi:hypothetical protein
MELRPRQFHHTVDDHQQRERPARNGEGTLDRPSLSQPWMRQA